MGIRWASAVPAEEERRMYIADRIRLQCVMIPAEKAIEAAWLTDLEIVSIRDTKQFAGN
jgi:hypothetical protein